MKKKLIAFVSFVLCFILLAQPVMANNENGQIDALAAYVKNTELTVFLNVPDAIAESSITAKIIDGDIDPNAEITLSRIEDAGKKTQYIYIIDTVSEKENYKELAKSVIEQSMSAERTNCSYTVLSVGEVYKLVCEEVSDTASVIKCVDEINFSNENASFYNGISSAFDYVEEKVESQGNLVNVIMISDGFANQTELMFEEEKPAELPSVLPNKEPEKESDNKKRPDNKTSDTEEEGTTEDNQTGSPAAKGVVDKEQLKERLSSITQCLKNTVIIGAYENEVVETLSGSVEDAILVDGPNTAKAAGETILSQTKTVFLAKCKAPAFQSKSEINARIQFDITDGDGNQSSLVTDVNGIINLDMIESGEDSGTDDGWMETSPEEDAPKSGIAKIAGIVGVAASSLVAIIAVVIVIILAIIIIILAIVIKRKPSKKNKKHTYTDNETSSDSYSFADIQSKPSVVKPAEYIDDGTGPQFTIEVLNGKLQDSRTTYRLSREITIGKGIDSIIKFEDNSIANVHARLFVVNDRIYIGEVTNIHAIYLEGMRIQKQNRVDSGDRICIGSTEFTIRY